LVSRVTSYQLYTKITWAQTVSDLRETFRKWGIIAWSIEPQTEALAIRSDGTVTVHFSGGSTARTSTRSTCWRS